MFSLNSREITVNLLAKISVHSEAHGLKKFSSSLFLSQDFFILPQSQKEVSPICSNVHVVKVIWQT